MTKRNVNINPERLDDPVLREMLTEIKEEMERETLSDWQGVHKEIDLGVAGTHEIGHGLGFIPKDVWITYMSSKTAYVRIEFDDFTTDTISLYTTTYGLTVRLFIGSYSTET